MTAQPSDRDWDRLDALVDEDPIALRDAAWRLAAALAAAEHRIARLEAQSDIRGRAVVMYRERAREAEKMRDHNRGIWRSRVRRHRAAEARINAVEAMHCEVYESLSGQTICDECDKPFPCPTIRALTQ